MPARKVSNMYYDGSAARKILPQEDKKTQRKRKDLKFQVIQVYYKK